MSKQLTPETPMVKQYLEIKQQHQDKILFFRLGDFYEMFFEDAKLVSGELELTLTGRGKDENRIPMCGIPYHALDSYLPRLINKGYKVAICEQTEDPALAKGLTKREVVRIVTPGTILESNMLTDKQSNYLMAVAKDKDKYGIALVEASTGDFKVTEVNSKAQLLDEISRFNPSEILLPEELKEEVSIHLTAFHPDSVKKSEEKLLAHFKVSSLASFGCQELDLAKIAASGAIDYLKETQKTALDHISRIKTYFLGDFMIFDNTTRRNLEINKTIRDNSFKGSLLWVLDQTKTSMGGRLLREWLNQPLLNLVKIKERQEAVAELANDLILREELKSFLKDIYDIERLTVKVANASANARDLVALKESLAILPELSSALGPTASALLVNVRKTISGTSSFQKILAMIDQALVPEPPLQIKEGGMIKRGHNAELDEIWNVSHGGKEWLIELENKEKARAGMKNLKVGYNRVFGYYIEVSASNLSLVPENYIRKQTLTNGERFITPELKEKETLLLNASERLVNLEYELFSALRKDVALHTLELQQLAQSIALLDVLLSLANNAVENNYVCPEIFPAEDHVLMIRDGRHPVIEKTLRNVSFTPNDNSMDQENERLIVLTGPNMSGKSTYMRQTALILLLAQIGSFVPCREAQLSIVDRIFTRVGAMDDIFAGQSTFMVEMTETANILNNATKNSFIILDELGRGTSTFDGMSLAWAVAEYIHLRIGAKTIFATHYHELVQLAGQYKGIKNYNVAVEEKNGKITFLHRVLPGGADKSYGIHVAELAGLPTELLGRAREILAGMESQQAEVMGDRQLKLF
ncbi:MAG: DNA mismatch repair protein MutS [Candidatus Margulisiibacteriota bacterium]|jgi:DNA mismatch repair protein MutS